MFVISDESKVLLMENSCHTSAESNASPAAVTAMLCITDKPQTSLPVLNSSSSADHRLYQSESNLQVPSHVTAAVMQSPDHSTSPTTSQSDVDISSRPLSPDSTADYAVAAQNVLDASDGYQHCGSHRAFTAIHFDTPPVDLRLLDSEDDELCSNNHSVASLQDFGKSVRSDKTRDEGPSRTISSPHKNDPYWSAAGQDSSQNLCDGSSDLPSSYMTSATVAVSSSGGGKDVEDFSNYSSGANAVTDRCSESSESELAGSGDYSSATQAAPDSASSDPGYARASVPKSRFLVEFSSSAAPLSPEYDVSDSIS